jgi:hypothetical protein
MPNRAKETGIEEKVELPAVVLAGPVLAPRVVVDTQGEPLQDLPQTETGILVVGNQCVEGFHPAASRFFF